MKNVKKPQTWIKIHTGLTNDKVHRERMGIRVWLFMWLVDHADWSSGVVYDYTDRWAGDEMGLSSRTIEDQRQTLERDGYIQCYQAFQCQFIRIMRWRDPRQVNPSQINIPGDETSYGTFRTHGTELSVPIPAESSVPLHIDQILSDSSTHVDGNDRPNIFTVYEQNIGVLSPMIVEKLKYWDALVPEEWIEHSIRIAVENNKRNIAYAEAILRRWQDQGFMDNGKRSIKPAVVDTWEGIE